MSEVMNLELAESLVLHYLAEKEAERSTSELQDELGLNRVIITRVLRGAKNRKPALVALVGGKYKFVGSKNVLSPLPEDYRVQFGLGAEDDAQTPSDSKQTISGLDVDSLGPIDKQVLEFLTTRKKAPQSGLMKQFNLEEDEAEAILSGLEENGLLVSEHLEGFDENSFSLSDKGKSLAETLFAQEQPRVEAKVTKKAPAPTTEPAVSRDAAKEEKEPMATSGRKFEIPSFEDIPEENASGRGRPTGDRDFEQLRVYILAYTAEKQPVAKSNISRTLAKVLSNFGRQTIVEEVDNLVKLGYIEDQIIGKREMFTLSEKGASTIRQISEGGTIQPLVANEKPFEPKKKAAPEEARAPAKKAAPASQPAPRPEPAPEAKAEPTPAVKAAPEPAPMQAKEAPKAADPYASQGAIDVEAGDISEIKGRIDALLKEVPGERGFELRQYFAQLSGRIKMLERSRAELSDICQGLIRKI